MKVAVSIPDDIFAEAELLAKGLKTSRSEIYSRALDAFIGSHAPERVTHAMNQVIDAVGDQPDDFSVLAATQRLKQVEW
jgi:metal-responsive CopG/Arc/MetJ family transcriptional regulator